MAKTIIGYDANGPIYEDDARNAPSKTAPASSSATVPPTASPVTDGPSKVESAIRGFANSATFGLAPRISAGVNTALGKVAPDVFGNEDYSTRLKDYLAADRAATQANPVTSLVSNVVGGAPSMVAGAAGSIPLQIAKAAGMGAISGAGNADEGQMIPSALIGGATQGAVAGAIPLAGKAINASRDIIQGTPDKAQIAEAIIKYKNTSSPLGGQGLSAEQLQARLQRDLNAQPVRNATGDIIDYRHADEFSKPLKSAEAQAVGDNVLREMAVNPNAKVDDMLVNKQDLQSIIDWHNKYNAPGAARTILGSAGGVAALGGATGYFSSGGDIGTAATSAAAGAVSGAVGGGRYRAVHNQSKLRMPVDPPSTRNLLADTANQQLAASASRDLNDRFGTPLSPFAKLSDFLASSGKEDATEEEKRKIAMEMNSTPDGRSITNSGQK